MHNPSGETYRLEEFDAPVCEGVEGAEWQEWQATVGLNPATPVDFIALRLVYAHEPSFTELDSSGIACEGALDAVTCEQELAGSAEGLSVTESCGGPPYPCQHYVVTTAGDSVVRWVTKDERVQLLAPIDTPAEAMLLAFDGTFKGYEVVCGAPDKASVRVVDDGFEVVLTRLVDDCMPIVTQRDLLHVDSDGTITVRRSSVSSVEHGCVGRRPEGLVSQPATSHNALGDFFANIAHLEAASVPAFHRLASELRSHGAPSELWSLALAAAADEVRHAETMGRLAARFGAKAQAPRVEPFRPRTLEEMACENAAEGCVRETFGALIAEYQARTAGDADIVRTMRGIAEDEARHAALAWRVAAWADTLLSDESRERVERARRLAVEELRRELEAIVPVELRSIAGVPAPVVALDLMRRLDPALWTTRGQSSIASASTL